MSEKKSSAHKKRNREAKPSDSSSNKSPSSPDSDSSLKKPPKTKSRGWKTLAGPTIIAALVAAGLVALSQTDKEVNEDNLVAEKDMLDTRKSELGWTGPNIDKPTASHRTFRKGYGAAAERLPAHIKPTAFRAGLYGHVAARKLDTAEDALKTMAQTRLKSVGDALKGLEGRSNVENEGSNNTPAPAQDAE